MAVSRDIDCRFLVLRDWIDEKELYLECLCINPNAIKYLYENHPVRIFEENEIKPLCLNENAVDLIINNLSLSQIEWYTLSMNKNAVKFLLQHENLINILGVLYNKNLVTLYENSQVLRDKLKFKNYLVALSKLGNTKSLNVIEENIEYIKKLSCDIPDSIVTNLCGCNNIKAIEILQTYFSEFKCVNDKIPCIENISYYSKNPCAILLIEKHAEQISDNIFNMCQNSNAIHILKDYRTELNPEWISENKNGIKLIENNPELVIIERLANNKNCLAMELFEKKFKELNYDKYKCVSSSYSEDDFYYYGLMRNISGNTNAIMFLEKHQQIIDWCELSRNPAIFTYDYNKIKEEKH